MFKSWRSRRDSGAATLRESMGIILKTTEEIEQMRVAGQLAGEVLRMIAPHVLLFHLLLLLRLLLFPLTFSCFFFPFSNPYF